MDHTRFSTGHAQGHKYAEMGQVQPERCTLPILAALQLGVAEKQYISVPYRLKPAQGAKRSISRQWSRHVCYKKFESNTPQ